ncbi:flavin reductase family protein [Aneurinibacillus sp. REN35]|uniref:flavin reductase family protein n=1 Tax=Aneurinibacillus sp. REN35 TaxID=3237286 RepID=UPI003527D5A4
MYWNLATLSAKDKYRMLTSCIVPRPIAWVTTMSACGVGNAAPFSYFTGVSIEPPLVLFAIERRDGKKKDTLLNIEDTKEFVINLVTAHNVVAMNETSKDYQPDEDELKLAGLDTVPSVCVKPPRIQQSPVHMECRLHDILEIGSSPHALVIGEVVAIHAADHLIKEDRIQMERLEAVGRMGGKWYVQAGDLFELPRLDWRKNEMI